MAKRHLVVKSTVIATVIEMEASEERVSVEMTLGAVILAEAAAVVSITKAGEGEEGIFTTTGEEGPTKTEELTKAAVADIIATMVGITTGTTITTIANIITININQLLLYNIL